MRNKTMVIFGAGIILLGVVMLLGNYFDFDLGSFFCPAVIILLGVWLLVSPRRKERAGNLRIAPFGDVKRYGDWQAADEDILMFVGDVKLDYSQADLMPGETHLRLSGFVSDVDIIVPEDVGLSVSSIAFVSDMNLNRQKMERFFFPFDYTSPGYAEKERQLKIEMFFFVVDADILFSS
jgi:lia operon protein LiaF